MNPTAKELIAAYIGMIEERIEDGWSPYLITMMFEPLSGSATSVARQMEREMERFYATLVTRVVRKPTAPTQIGYLPILIGCPDFPVPKHKKVTLSSVAINNGRHLHATGLMPPKSRMKVPFDEHVEQNYAHYVQAESRLDRIDVLPITHKAGYVVGYGMKALERGRVTADDMIVLPRTRCEMRDRR